MTTVKELIDHLSVYDGDTPVFVKGYEWGWQDAKLPHLAWVHLNAMSDTWGGPHEDIKESDQKILTEMAEGMGDPPPTFIQAVLLPRS